MKIDILTFSKENNFGANLQCYALSKVLTDMGHVVEILDLQLPKPKYSFPGNITLAIGNYIHQSFRKEFFPMFSKQYNAADYSNKEVFHADLYIVGSDQVWNVDITKRGLAKAYFFDFLPEGVKRISYAASFGVQAWSKTPYDEVIKDSLKKFSSISVRELSGVNICNDTFDVKAETVLDPTLLLENYDEITGIGDSKNNGELICYKFVNSEKFFNVCRHIANELNLKPVLLNQNRPRNGFIFRPFVTMKTWLDSLKNSSFVITDSFHCMVFAILFNRQFIALPSHPGRVERLVSLLSKLGLKNRLYMNIEDIYSNDEWKSTIEYKDVFSKLNKERADSVSFLKNAINK